MRVFELGIEPARLAMPSAFSLHQRDTVVRLLTSPISNEA